MRAIKAIFSVFVATCDNFFSAVAKYSCNVAKLVFFSVVVDRTCVVSRINSAARPEDQSWLNQADVEHGLRGLVY